MSEETFEIDPVVTQKINNGKQKKDTADQAFKQGKMTDALRSYHESLMYLTGLDRNALKAMNGGPPPEPAAEGSDKPIQEKTEVDELVEKIYANMSACHMKNENWQRALETANKALAKNENNYKAMFRKGKALGELGFFDKAEKVLEDLKTKNPSDAAGVGAELSRLRAIDLAKEKANKQRLKGFLSRPEKEKKTPAEPKIPISKATPAPAPAPSLSTAPAVVEDSGVEEIMSPGVAAAGRG